MAEIKMMLVLEDELHAKIKAEAEQQERSFAGQVRFILGNFFINKDNEE